MMKKYKVVLLNISILLMLTALTACSNTSTKTVQLSYVIHDQAINLQKSHIQFVKKYYEKMRKDVTVFIETKWTPEFLSKVVKNKGFRKQLDEAYYLSAIKASDLSIKWKGDVLAEPQKSAIESSIERMAKKERSRLGEVLLGFAEAAQFQINKKRSELLKPVISQEKMVLNQVNTAWSELITAQSRITAHLESAVEIKKSQDEALKKLGLIEKREKMMKTLMANDDELTKLLGEDESPEDVVKKFKEKLKKLEKKIK